MTLGDVFAGHTSLDPWLKERTAWHTKRAADLMAWEESVERFSFK